MMIAKQQTPKKSKSVPNETIELPYGFTDLSETSGTFVLALRLLTLNSWYIYYNVELACLRTVALMDVRSRKR